MRQITLIGTRTLKLTRFLRLVTQRLTNDRAFGFLKLHCVHKKMTAAQLHFFGSIHSAFNFCGNHNLCCKWSISSGPEWNCVQGNLQGQTHLDLPAFNRKVAMWNCPFDLHFVTSTIQGNRN
ncbi:hypothetical protein ACOME3_003485 [Neoechinorhynchus agilis]